MRFIADSTVANF